MLSSFHQVQKVRCRGEEWQILNAQKHEIKLSGGESKIVWELEAEALSGIVKGERYVFLNDIDEIELVDPTQIRLTVDTSKNVRKSRTYLEAHLRRLLPRNGAIYLGEHGAFMRMDYQLKPAAKALDMIRPRILIGDAVGLGKTIECGILLSELMRRGKARRVLAAVPKAILEQFQMEMWGRFAIPFHRLDTKGLERLRQDLPSSMNPFFHFDKAIISIDTLKLKKYQKLLEDCQWDVLIIDECHNVADRTDGLGGSARHKVAKRLAENSRSVMLMSATPHDGTKYGFASLVKLLDRTLIPSDENYTADDVAKVFIRRTRTTLRNELGALPARKELMTHVPLKTEEVDLLQMIHDIDLRSTSLSGRAKRGVRELFKTTLIKSFLSSPAALMETVGKKIKNLEKHLDSKESDQSEAENEKALNVLKDIHHSCEKIGGKFTRLEKLIQFIKDEPVENDNKIVIFTERIATMNYVAQKILEAKLVKGTYDAKADSQVSGFLLATAHGGETDVDLNKIVKAFQSNTSKVNILVTTNVSSEGLNLHDNCHRLVHFDLPWSLITLEQRNGRIDRLGQTKQPIIHYFASTAGPKTRQAPDQNVLKDDFWIVEKIERRMKQAAEDMDEEARRRFTTGEDEEEQNTEKYESGQINNEGEAMNAMLQLMENIAAEHKANPSDTKIKTLPTLFDKSPGDFVETLAKEVDIPITEHQTTEVRLKLDKKLQYEVHEHWPKEFRPESEELALEMNKEKMEKHYKARLNSQEALDKTFMNEIHPAINLLEHTALGLFPGQEVPVIHVEAAPGSIYFLLQGTLYNKANEAVFQSWQVVEFSKGSNKCEKLVDLTEPNHTKEVAEWVREALDNEKGIHELSPFEQKRILSLTKPALDWMTKLVNDAREKRAEIELPRLKEEKKRIEAWEKSRRDYLTSLKSSDGKDLHGGFFAMVKNAEEELETLNQDTKAFTEYITKYMSTDSNPDIRILAVFSSTES